MKNNILTLFSFILNFLLIRFIISKTENNLIIETNLYPRLWSCLYKEADNRYKNAFRSQFGEDKLFYANYFKNKLNGIYVELGALDGLLFSNSYFFENYLGWSGILIEGGYDSCIKLINNQNKRPRSQIVCSAICKDEYAEFKQKLAVGGLSDALPTKWFGLEKKDSIIVRCSNISNILHIHKVTHIDLFSLDVEGGELNVLETFDFSIYVHYWTIEFNSDKDYKNQRVKEILKDHCYKPCSLKLKNTNECWEDINYENKVKKLKEEENMFRSNFGVKCNI